MESLWEWLVTTHEGFGRATGDEALMGALFETAESLLTSPQLRLAVVAGGCQADPVSLTPERLDRLATGAAAFCLVECSPACGPATLTSGDLGVEVVRIPTLHQTNTGPFLIALDRRSGFGMLLVSRRLDTPQSRWRAATHEVAWSLSTDVASAALQMIGSQISVSSDDRPPRAIAAAAVNIPPTAPRPRMRSRAKPGATASLRVAEDVTVGRETALALMGRLLAVLQTAATFDGSITELAASAAHSRDFDAILDSAAESLGRALDASRVSIRIGEPALLDNAPTADLAVPGGLEDIRQGVYTRIDTRRLDTMRLDRTEAGPVVSRLLIPIQRESEEIGEIRVLDTRVTRAWTAMEQRYVERAAALLSSTSAKLQADVGPAVSTPTTDGLTGLEHRAAFDWRLREAIAETIRDSGHLSLIRLTIERLADINEMHGYAVGDAAIRHIAQILQERFGQDAEFRLARFGGEGFAVLLPGFGVAAASRVASYVSTAVNETPMPPIGSIITRVGVATFPDDAESAEALATTARSRMI